VVSQAGGVLLTETVRVVGLDRALSAALAPWRRPLAVHNPAKIVLDLAVTLALGGDCLADIALLRAEPGVYGLVASDPTVSRTIERLAQDAPRALAVIHAARGRGCSGVGTGGGKRPRSRRRRRDTADHRCGATLASALSDKQGAAPTVKRGYGHHPLWTFCDHGPAGTGELALRVARH
jgi:hypothetical protein